MDCTNKAINYPPKSNNSDKTALKNICHPAVYVQLTFALQSKQEHTLFGLCADFCMQTDHFDAKNLKNEIVQKGSGVFDQLHSNPFDQVPAWDRSSILSSFWSWAVNTPPRQTTNISSINQVRTERGPRPITSFLNRMRAFPTSDSNSPLVFICLMVLGKRKLF